MHDSDKMSTIHLKIFAKENEAMKNCSMLWTAIEYVFTYGFSWGYYYCAGSFGYVKSHSQQKHMGTLQAGLAAA